MVSTFTFIDIPDLTSIEMTSRVALPSAMPALDPTKVGHAVPTARIERATETAGASESRVAIGIDYHA